MAAFTNAEINNAKEMGKSKFRVDGRDFNEFASLSIETNLDNQSCIVTYGGTKLLGKVYYEIVQPVDSSPVDGILKFHVIHDRTSIQASSNHDLNNNITLVIRYLEKCFKESRTVDLESMCIIRGSKVMKLNFILEFLTSDGCLFDTACIAAYILLKIFRKPEISVEDHNITIHNFDDIAPTKVSLFQVPMLFQVAFDSDGNYIMSPSDLELQHLSNSSLVLGITRTEEVLCLNYVSGHNSENIIKIFQAIMPLLTAEIDERINFIDNRLGLCN